jgi:hypothetical protein
VIPGLKAGAMDKNNQTLINEIRTSNIVNRMFEYSKMPIPERIFKNSRTFDQRPLKSERDTIARLLIYSYGLMPGWQVQGGAL